MRYYYPCKPNPLSPDSRFFAELDRDMSWIAEIKKNGWRCLAMKNKNLILWTRHKTRIAAPLTNIRQVLTDLPDDTLLDGELISTRRVKGINDSLYLFDIIMFKGELLVSKPLHQRRAILEIVYKDYLPIPEIELARQTQVGKKTLYETMIKEKVNEGIVLKKLDSKYLISESRCQQNPFWLKVKRTENHIYVNPYCPSHTEGCEEAGAKGGDAY